jgi:hypothetical protein
MIWLAHHEMYLSVQRRAASLLAKGLFWLVAVTTLAGAAHSWQARTEWNDAAAELVGKVMERAGRPSVISLALSNNSLLSPSDTTEVRRALETQLASRGIRIVKPEQALSDLRITLSENAAGLLWVADVSSGTRREIIMTQVPRSEIPVAAQNSPALILRKELIWSQYEPILDFAFWDNRSWLLVLEPRAVSLFRSHEGRWRLEETLPVPRSAAPSADVRGRLLILPDRKFEVFLPGQRCVGMADSALTLQCRQADDPWPLAGENSPRAFFSANRNFFTGVLTGNAPKPSAPFFSAARVDAAGREVWVFAGTDGRLRMFDGAESELRAGWGSALGAIKSSCGSGWQVLATGAADWTERDSIQAFELASSPAPATAPVELSGPVTALWPAAEGNSGNAVVRNLTSGKYEALSFSVSCR